jgi:D-aminopeptidase
MRQTTVVLFLLSLSLAAQTKPRLRDLGVPFDGTPGPLNAITDVKGVTVDHTTLVEGNKVRTGVTAVLPRGAQNIDKMFAGWWTLAPPAYTFDSLAGAGLASLFDRVAA